MSSSPSAGIVVVGERVRVRATQEGFVDAVGRVAELTEDGFKLALEIPSPNYPVGKVVTLRWSNGGVIERDLSDPPETLVRLYTGRQQADATVAFTREAEVLAKAGYEPVAQSWAHGQWGCGAFILALLLAIILIGLLVFAYLLIVKPDGTLTVTYGWRPPRPRQEIPANDTKVCPRCAETIKAAALVCRFCGHEFEPGNGG